jgi:predicted HicB family RNase H-like nuclease
LEGGTNWNLSSKYNVQQLLKDAQLKLQPRELYRPDMQPKYLDIVQQAANLQKLRQDHSTKDLYPAFKATVDNGARRLERIEKEIRGSQIDATDLARLPDTLFIQLDHVLAAPTIQMELLDTEEKLEHLLFKLEETKEARAVALDDGEMQLAEKKFYNVVEIYEEILEHVLAKLATVEKTQKESQVFDKVREQYQQKAADDANKLNDAKEQLKKRCEADLKKIFALKERVDSVEKATVTKLNDERKRSDQLLADNATQQEVTWAKIEELERELERLEKERYTEIKKRVLDKDKDEHRRMEYEKFCQVVDNQSQLLDLTIRNCDTAMHCIALSAEFVNSGFNTLASDLAKKDKELSALLVETHKQHLEMFRGLYLALGELAHKKDKRIEEIDKAIQSSHIQQEIAAETLNPNAKKYSDAKKELLRARDDVEEDLNELKEKAQVALGNFAVSEQALQDAGIDFVHPTVEQQEQELETKAKMVEYKAIAIGQVDALPIKAELETIKMHLQETKEHVRSVNRSTMSYASTLPLIRAGTPTSFSGSYSASPSH